MAEQLPFDFYELGVTRDTDDRVWSLSGLNGSPLHELFGLFDRVSAMGAMEISAAMICLDVLAQDISKAELRLKKKKGKGGEEVVDARKHDLAKMLALDPNRRHTWIEVISMLVYHLGLASNTYAYVKRDVADRVLEIIPLQPRRVTERLNQKTGETFYDITATNVHEIALLGFDFKTVPEADMIHVRQRMLDGFWGYATLAAGNRTLQLAKKLEDYEETLFGEDGLLRGFFQRGKSSEVGKINDGEFQRIKSQLKQVFSQRRNDPNNPVLLEDGITWEKMSMNAKEAEMSKALDNSVERIARLWRMPPHKIMHLGAVKYENLATLEMIYVRDTLLPLCKLIEERLNRTLLSQRERLSMRFEFDRDALTVVDSTAETNRLKMMVERGIISHNEARAEQGYNPREGGDVYTLPANTKLINDRNDTVATGAKEEAPGGNEEQAPEEQETPEKAVEPFVPRLVG